MPRYVIERDIPGAGKLSAEELRAISQRSRAASRLDENLDVTGAGIDEDGNCVSDGPATAATVDCDTVTLP